MLCLPTYLCIFRFEVSFNNSKLSKALWMIIFIDERFRDRYGTCYILDHHRRVGASAFVGSSEVRQSDVSIHQFWCEQHGIRFGFVGFDDFIAR